MIVLKGFLAVIVFSLPFFVGFIFRRKSYVESYLFGQVLLWAVFQIIAVPMIHLRLTFNTLWIVYTVVMTGLSVWGIKRKIETGWNPASKINRKDLIHYLP